MITERRYIMKQKLLAKSYARGYAEGVHDGLLDVLNKLGIKTDEEYYD